MNWYRLDADDVLHQLGSSMEGLSNAQVKERILKYGPNQLPQAGKFAAWKFLWGQVKSPLVFILLLAGFITMAIGEYVDMSIIFMSVAVNIGIGFYQEYSSNKILEKLSRMIRVQAYAKRAGYIKVLDADELVPGDIISLKAGMKVPADARVLYVKEFAVNEALLTGESNPVEKLLPPLSVDMVIGDQKNMVFTGTTVDRGEALAVVTATAKETELGKIADLTQKAEEEKTPLQERLEGLGRMITIIVSIAAILIVIVGVLEKMDFVEIFVTSVAVAVAAIPEGLPAALAVILAVSSQKISRSGGLVKKLIAAESLGSTSIICADKTGTLTEGKMQVEKVLPIGDKEKLLTGLALANEAIIESDATIQGESTDQAKMHAFFAADLSLEKVLAAMPRLAMIPFDSVNKYIGSFHKISDSKIALFVSGAPELFIETLGEDKKVSAKKEYEGLALQGYRMIGVGYREFDANPETVKDLKQEDLKKYVTEMEYLGLAAIRDPIRQDVKEIMNEVRKAGLKVVMITGDHKLTAMAIGKELGILIGDHRVMEGQELNNLSDDQLRERVRDIDIFARVDPVHKLRVVRAWKELGESVAATGDGINDAPALKTADVGIAVASGTDVTKEAADLVLMNDGFVTIIEAIRQGRAAFHNIKKVVIFLLSNSFTELILVLGALILRVPLPITAVQILWTNLVEDGLPNFALAFEPPEERVMRQKPISRKTPLLDSEGKFLSFPLGIATDLILFFIYFELLEQSHLSIEYIRTFIFAALGTDSLFYIFGLRSLDHSVFRINPFQNKYLIGAILLGLVMMTAAVYLPFFNRILETEPLSAMHALYIVGLGVYKLLLVEGVKWFYNRRKKMA